MFAGLKKCTRDGAWSLFEYAGSKKYTLISVKLRLCLWVQKNAPAMLLVAPRVCGFKKIYPRCCWLLFVFMGSKNAPAMVLGRYLRLRVKKKCTRDVVWLLFVFVG